MQGYSNRYSISALTRRPTRRPICLQPQHCWRLTDFRLHSHRSNWNYPPPQTGAGVTQPTDDLEAVRVIAETLKTFNDDDRERVIRWAREKLDMGAGGGAVLPPAGPGSKAPSAPPPAPAAKDIRTFIDEKHPKNDIQLAAVVAFYHRFVALEGQRRESITKEDFLEGCRQSNRQRPPRPDQTMINAYQQGLLDRGEPGQYVINSVGENLVAVVLPDDGGETKERGTVNRQIARKKRARKNSRGKKTAKKKKTKGANKKRHESGRR